MCPTVKLDNFIQDQRILPAFCQMKILTPALVDKIAEVKEDAMLDQDFMEHVETIFQSKASLNGSFLTPAHQPCNSRNSGIDMPSWQNFYKVIENCHHDSLREAIHSSITQFVIPNLRMTPPDVETLRIFLTLPLYHRFQDPELFEDLHTPFAKCLISLDKNPWSVVEKWLCQQDANYFKLIVQNIKKVVILILKKKTRSSVTSYNRQLELNLVLLRILNRINVEQNLIIDYEDFYIPEVSEYLPLPEQYGRWLLAKKNGGSSGDFYICNYPFVFDAQAKSTLLQVDQAFQMQQAVQEAHHKAAFFHQMIFNPAITPEMMSFLHLNVDRENLLQDTLAQIQLLTPDDLKKPMRVQFNGEDGEDAGGVKKEFFLLLLKDLLNPKYGMFKEYDESRTIWFHPNSFEDNVMFFLIGVICGLAIYNFTIISLPYPLALYKKLLSEKVNRIEDFQELSPTEARGLKDLLEYEGDDIEDVFCLDFAISETCFDVTKSVPLKEGGEQIPVTKANREEYVSLYCDYILNKSCKKQYEAFHQGFHKVCGGRVLDLFHARELMTLVVGKEVFDWEELEKTAEYKVSVI